MALRGAPCGQYAAVEEMYERDGTAQYARSKIRLEQIEDELGILANQVVALTVTNRPCKRPINLCTPEEEEVLVDVTTSPFTRPKERDRGVMATFERPFTSNIIPDLIVDWSKPPIFDEEPFIDGNNMIDYILPDEIMNQSNKSVSVHFDEVYVKGIFLQVLCGEVQDMKSHVGHFNSLDIDWAELFLFNMDIKYEAKVYFDMINYYSDHIFGSYEFKENSKSIYNMENIFDDLFEEKFYENFTNLSLKRSDLGFDEDGLNLSKKVVPFILEDCSLKFKFEKINLKYKVDADKCRRVKLF
ncbi:hypothetical protein ACSBR1_029451 [Camellia fascicularis]